MAANCIASPPFGIIEREPFSTDANRKMTNGEFVARHLPPAQPHRPSPYGNACTAASSFTPIGVPHPDTRIIPHPALYPPAFAVVLFPDTISVHVIDPTVGVPVPLLRILVKHRRQIPRPLPLRQLHPLISAISDATSGVAAARPRRSPPLSHPRPADTARHPSPHSPPHPERTAPQSNHGSPTKSSLPPASLDAESSRSPHPGAPAVVVPQPVPLKPHNIPPRCPLLSESSSPPTAITYGLLDGKSAYACPSLIESLDPSSPAATHTVTPHVRPPPAATGSSAESPAASRLEALCSANPQLTEITVGLFFWSCITASSHTQSTPSP